MMEESIFKSCLKRKVKFTASTFVKFLITGTVALSLTACGGGGGGGGSSSGGNGGGNVTTTTEIHKTVENDTFIADKNINFDLSSSTADSVTGILGKDSTIVNNTTIKINDKANNGQAISLASKTGENILKKFQEKGKSFAIFAEGGSVTNAEEGRLNITGDSVTGIVGVYSDITNKGKIFTTDKIEDTKEAVGIMSIGSNVTNDGDINLVSYDGIGIWAFNNGANLDGIIVDNNGKRISVINNGNISIKGEESRGIVADGADIDVVNNGNLSLEGIDVDGIVVQGNNISVKNNKGAEIVVTNNGTKENHEKIEYISGINIKKGQGNTVVNEGNITVSINTDDGVYVASGITSDEKVDVTNSGTITVNSDIKPDNYTEDIDFETYAKDYSYGIKTNGKVINEIGGEINISGTAIGMTGKDVTNNGTINITGIDAETDDGVKTPAGIFVSGKDSTATNNGNITGEKNFTVGMFAYDGATVINEKNGKITTARGFDGYNGHIINYGTVETTDHAAEIAGGTLTNYGTMSSTGEEVIYIEEGGIATNETTGTINVNADYSTGFYADEEDDDIIKGSKGINKGTINVNGINSWGMIARGNTSYVTNSGIINADANTSFGMWAEENGTAINEKDGIINVNGTNSYGMYAYQNGTAENYGVINVNGAGSYGMIAYQGGTAINEEGATINVGADALSGMVADGGTTYNYGTINIDENNKITEENDITTTDRDSDVGLEDVEIYYSVLKSAITVVNGGKAYNYGEIYKGGNLILSSDSTSSYIIGTNKDGSYGKVSAETVTVDGNVKVSAEMAKEGYKDSYALNNAIAGKTELGKNYKLSSTSLLYNAVSKTDEEGNLDVELVRNDTDISDLTSKEISKVAGIFDSAMKDETLSKKEKEILEKVFDSTSSAKAVDDTIKEFTGYNVYSNIARQIFDTKDMFVSYDKSIIDSLGDYSFNFNFIGNYADVNSKNGTAGYDSKVTGINGAVRFTDSLYGVIGYGYNDVDYDGSSDGTIETIHTGIYKDIKSQFGDIRTGIFGEYNFHETDRKVFGEKADSDFNSYLIGANVEISRKFGDDLYIKPALSFDLSYGKYEDFKEDGGADVKFEKQDYVSAVPAIELKLGKEFETSEIYGAVKYSYELGDLNKEQEIELFEYREDFQADNIEDAQTDVKFGASFNIKNISVNAELGKEFGKRDREYVKAGFSYIF